MLLRPKAINLMIAIHFDVFLVVRLIPIHLMLNNHFKRTVVQYSHNPLNFRIISQVSLCTKLAVVIHVLTQKPSYRVCHRFRLTKRVAYF